MKGFNENMYARVYLCVCACVYTNHVLYLWNDLRSSCWQIAVRVKARKNRKAIIGDLAKLMLLGAISYIYIVKIKFLKRVPYVPNG